MEKVNLVPLMQYISRRFHTAVHRISKMGVSKKRVCERPDLSDDMDLTEEGEHELFRALLVCRDAEHPVIAMGSHSVSYGIAGAGDDYFVLGPVALAAGEACRFRLAEHAYEAAWLEKLYRCPASELVEAVLLFHNLFREEPCALNRAIAFNCLEERITYDVRRNYTDIVFANQEQESRHNPYDQEVREVASIRNGDPEQLKRAWEEDYTGKLGVLAKTTLRNFQNLGIVLVTLGSRAAMEGGVMPELAYSLSDSYIQKIEEASSPEMARQLGRDAEYEYALLVKEVKEQQKRRDAKVQDFRVGQCKDYIFSHLHERIHTSDIAKALYLNANYLSGLFKKEEGITISAYILREKVRLAKNMLMYSRYSNIEIASYLGFCSQSHLGAQFKKETGMTLHQYREQYGKREFIDGRNDRSW